MKLTGRLLIAFALTQFIAVLSEGAGSELVYSSK
jgi:hypothetical protein